MEDKFTQFTLEEIYFIRNCGNDNKRETVNVFKICHGRFSRNHTKFNKENTGTVGRGVPRT